MKIFYLFLIFSVVVFFFWKDGTKKNVGTYEGHTTLGGKLKVILKLMAIKLLLRPHLENYLPLNPTWILHGC